MATAPPRSGPIAAVAVGLAIVALVAAERASAAAEDATAERCAPAPERIVGWAEKVRLIDAGLEREARIDTGAALSSVDASLIRIVEPAEPTLPQRVVFSIDDDRGGTRTLEKDIVDWVSIKNKGAPGATRRPVVTMQICLAGTQIEDRVNLAERDGFSYPVLIGRNALAAGGFLVDSTLRFLREPACRE